MYDISIIIPTYNRPETLKNCLYSLVNQLYPKEKYEILIIDDGSERNIQPIVEYFQNGFPDLKYLYQEHRGVSAARNLGIRQAKAELLSFVADDYYLPKEYLTHVLKFFTEYPYAHVLTFNINSRGNGLFGLIFQYYQQLALINQCKCHSVSLNTPLKSYNLPASRAAVFRKEVFFRIGLFDENLIGGEDSDLTLRLRRKDIPVYFIPNCYIEHWERKNILSFLKQRKEYSHYYFNFIKKWNPNARALKPALSRILKNTFKQSYRLLLCSKINNSLHRFIMFSPFILMFSFYYHISFYRKCKIERNKRAIS